jgi:trimeric autotransporter adhesin
VNEGEITTPGGGAATHGASAASPGSSSATAADSKPDSDSKTEEKKDGVAPQDSGPRKDDTVKKMYCN